LSPDQQKALARDGKLFGVVKLERPVKHPNGEVEMPRGWLSDVPEGHPWRKNLTPGDDAYYSFVEERLFKARLYDPQNPEHRKAAEAYLEKVNGDDPRFVGWTFAVRTECPKKKLDAPGTGAKDAEPDGE
jgi:hypothetical protein